MKINIRGDSVEIEGYVNAIERNSRPLTSRIGKFIERVRKGAFKRALERNKNVRILLNHNWKRDLGGTGDGNLQLEEDAIGLHAKATITDPEVVEKARAGDLMGWSFGFRDRDVENATEGGMLLRVLNDLDLDEVSLIDRRMIPCYEGTLVSVRAEDGEDQVQYHGEAPCDEVEVTEEKEEETKERADETEEEKSGKKSVENTVENTVEKNGNIDYTRYENLIKEMKGAK